jgi:hypothetical protein
MVTRLFEDASGASHFDEIDVDMSPPPISTSALQDANGILFMGVAGDTKMEAHRAPRRQYMIVLQGEWECTSTDGETRRFGLGPTTRPGRSGHATGTPISSPSLGSRST